MSDAVQPDRLYAVTLYQRGSRPPVCAGVIVRSGHVVDCAPVFNWMRGKSWNSVKLWRKIKTIEECPRRWERSERKNAAALANQ